MRPQVKQVLEALLAGDRAITLDSIGDALGTMAVTPREIEELIDAVEASGRAIAPTRPLTSEAKGLGTQRLSVVLATARALRSELGRAPTAVEVAERSGLDLTAVRHALALARVMQR